MADPKHPRHYDEAFKRQIVQLYDERQAIPEDPPSWPDILRTIELGYSNARLEASNNRIKVTIRMAYGFHHANSLIALVMLRCAGNHGASDNRDTPLLTYRRSMVL